MNSMETIARALDDPTTHDTLKAAIRDFVRCDPVDAANDTEWLAEVMQLRLAEITKGHRRAFELKIRGLDGGAPT